MTWQQLLSNNFPTHSSPSPSTSSAYAPAPPTAAASRASLSGGFASAPSASVGTGVTGAVTPPSVKSTSAAAGTTATSLASVNNASPSLRHPSPLAVRARQEKMKHLQQKNVAPTTPSKAAAATKPDQGRNTTTNNQTTATKPTVSQKYTSPMKDKKKTPKGTINEFRRNRYLNKKHLLGDRVGATNRKSTDSDEFAGMDPADMDPETRRAFELRQARLQFARDFIKGIAAVEQERRESRVERTVPPEQQPIKRTSNITVAVRKRPLLHYERDRGDFDVVRMESNHRVVVYHTRMAEAEKETKTVQPVSFGRVDTFLDERTTNGEVYERAAKPMVRNARNGGMSTIIMFGQTGSGKRYTLDAIEDRAVKELFAGLPPTSEVKVQFILVGAQCKDLLDDNNTNVRIACGEGSDPTVRFVNALSLKVDSPAVLTSHMASAKRRVSRPDQGHLVCRLSIRYSLGQATGSLLLVACAGSENRNTKGGGEFQSKALRAELNASLADVKAYLGSQLTGGETGAPPHEHHSNLVRLLSPNFERNDSKLLLLACVSPLATATEQTIQTLKTVAPIVMGADTTIPTTESQTLQQDVPPLPNRWDHTQLCEWLIKKHLLMDPCCVSNDLDGRKVMTLSKDQLRDVVYGGEDAAKADLLYRALRAERDRVSRLQIKRKMACNQRQ